MSRFGLNECEHARVWAALAPDGELSELEQRSLRAHLTTCGSCARFALEVEHVALLVRRDELARPSLPTALPRVVHRRRAVAARFRPVVAAAAVALMALGIASRAPLQMDRRESNVRATTVPSAEQQLEMQSLRVLRQGALAAVEGLDPMILSVNRPA
jgi:predicted anti-sigma-YlaC factor YlaD